MRIRAQFAELGPEPMPMTVAEFRKFVADETENGQGGQVLRREGGLIYMSRKLELVARRSYSAYSRAGGKAAGWKQRGRARRRKTR